MDKLKELNGILSGIPDEYYRCYRIGHKAIDLYNSIKRLKKITGKEVKELNVLIASFSVLPEKHCDALCHFFMSVLLEKKLKMMDNNME